MRPQSLLVAATVVLSAALINPMESAAQRQRSPNGNGGQQRDSGGGQQRESGGGRQRENGGGQQRESGGARQRGDSGGGGQRSDAGARQQDAPRARRATHSRAVIATETEPTPAGASRRSYVRSRRPAGALRGGAGGGAAQSATPLSDRCRPQQRRSRQRDSQPRRRRQRRSGSHRWRQRRSR